MKAVLTMTGSWDRICLKDSGLYSTGTEHPGGPYTGHSLFLIRRPIGQFKGARKFLPFHSICTMTSFLRFENCSLSVCVCVGGGANPCVHVLAIGCLPVYFSILFQFTF